MSATFHPVAPVDAVPVNGNKAFTVAGQNILICASGETFYALENKCTHQAAPLEGGKVRGVQLFCPLHGARFDLRDGSTKGALTQKAVKTYPVRVVNGMVEVEIEG